MKKQGKKARHDYNGGRTRATERDRGCDLPLFECDDPLVPVDDSTSGQERVGRSRRADCKEKTRSANGEVSVTRNRAAKKWQRKEWTY